MSCLNILTVIMLKLKRSFVFIYDICSDPLHTLNSYGHKQHTNIKYLQSSCPKYCTVDKQVFSIFHTEDTICKCITF